MNLDRLDAAQARLDTQEAECPDDEEDMRQEYYRDLADEMHPRNDES